MREYLMNDPSLEAIDFQGGALFSDLTAAIAKVRSGRAISQKDLDDVEIPSIVRAHTGISLTIQIQDDPAYNASVIPPVVDKNHPFYAEWVRPLLGKEGVDAIRAAGGKVTAGVDRRTGKVFGLYTKVTAQAFLTRGLLESKKFSDAEIAAIFLHEIGHVESYFEYLGNTFRANYVLSATTAAIMQTSGVKEREVILMEAEKALGVKIHDREKLAEVDNTSANGTIAVVFLSEMATKSRSETGFNLYDIRSWEQLSDQFATRHGAGRDLVTALDKIWRSYGHDAVLSTPTFLVMEVAKFLTLSGFILIPVAVGAAPLALPGIFYLIVIMGISNPQEKIYDDPKDRVKMVKQQVIEALKNKSISDVKRKQLLADVDFIQSIEDDLESRRGFVEFLWAKVFPWGRKSASQAEMMKELEQLANNELFVVATKFKLGVNHA